MQVHPVLEVLEDVLANLYHVVDSRVYVSVGRGLWDCSSQHVYEYLEGLQEGLGVNKVGLPEHPDSSVWSRVVNYVIIMTTATGTA